MEKISFNVLWMDDEWGNPQMDGYYNDYKDLQTDGHYINIDITKCMNFDELKTMIEDGHKQYHAVILDVMGYLNADQQNVPISRPFLSACRFLEEKKIKIIPFTANERSADNNDVKGMFEDFKLKPHYKDDGIEEVLKELDSFFSKRYHLYKGFPELLSLFNNNYMSVKWQTTVENVIKELNEFNKLPDIDLYHSMRESLKSMLEEITSKKNNDDYWLINNNYKKLKGDPNGRFGRLCDYISFWYLEKSRDQFLVSKKSCPSEIKSAISFLRVMLNAGTHNGEKPEEDRVEVFDNDNLSQLLMKRSVCSAYLLVLKWYYDYRSGKYPRKIAEECMKIG